MKYGLTEATIAKICQVLAKFPEIKTAVLYGSRAKGNYKSGSDIDLTLYGAVLTSKILADIEDALDDLFLRYGIDLSNFADLDNNELRQHIERVGIVFYKALDTATPKDQ